MTAPGYHSMSPDQAPMSEPPGGNMIPAGMMAGLVADLASELRRPPDWYDEREVRDRRWLWLRKKTVRIPGYHPIRRLS